MKRQFLAAACLCVGITASAADFAKEAIAIPAPDGVNKIICEVENDVTNALCIYGFYKSHDKTGEAFNGLTNIARAASTYAVGGAMVEKRLSDEQIALNVLSDVAVNHEINIRNYGREMIRQYETYMQLANDLKIVSEEMKRVQAELDLLDELIEEYRKERALREKRKNERILRDKKRDVARALERAKRKAKSETRKGLK